MAQAAMDTPNMSEQSIQLPYSNDSRFLPMHEESEAEQQEEPNSLSRGQATRGFNLATDI